MRTHLELVLKAYSREPSGDRQSDEIPCVRVVREGANAEEGVLPDNEEDEGCEFAAGDDENEDGSELERGGGPSISNDETGV